MQNPAVEFIFGRKMVRNAVDNAFLNTNNRNSVPMRSSSFQQLERRAHAFRLEMTPGFRQCLTGDAVKITRSID